MRKIRFLAEAAILYATYGFFSLLSPEAASNIGGMIGRTIGRFHPFSDRAQKNITRALPELSPESVKKAIIGMWDNLGRVFAEYPHLEKIAAKNVTVINRHIVEDVIKKGQGGIFIGAHLANWEISIPTLLIQHNVAAHVTYRAANNPYSDRLLEKSRSLNGRIKGFPKSRSSAKDLMTALKNKEFLGILVDQKFNEGLSVPFFGIPAMTNTAFVLLAQKFKCPLIPTQTRRTGAARFEIIVHDPLTIFDDQGNPLPPEQVISVVHALFEKNIREAPAHWLWLHRRWGKID
ncbi:MAG: lysophospholipid acyltransferase family protein [Alphaproteobacteria bacterium]